MYTFYGDDFKVECPTGSGNYMTLFEVAKEISAPAVEHLPARRERQAAGLWRHQKFQEDPHWRDYILFYEYFHGDNGAGLGASHQTGWTGLIARTLDLFARLPRQRCWRPSNRPVLGDMTREQVAGERTASERTASEPTASERT